MKRIALILAIVMMMSCFACVFASADYTTVVYTFAPAVEDITYLGTETDGIPDDAFAVGLRLDTQGQKFCRFKIRMSYDPTKLGYITCSESEGECLLGQYDPGDYRITKYDICNDPTSGNREPGDLILTMTNAYNMTYKQGLKTYDLTKCTMVILYFYPLTDEPCDTTLSWTYTECMNAIPEEIPSIGENYTLKLNGGAPEAAAPLESLGAKVNEDLVGLRFGATYNKVAENGEVTDLGMMLLPSAKLGEDTLDLNYIANGANGSLVAKLSAKGIDADSYVANQAFADYTSFTYTCTVIGLDGHEDADIVAVPYITYDGTGTISEYYADAMVRNYAAVLAANA